MKRQAPRYSRWHGIFTRVFASGAGWMALALLALTARAEVPSQEKHYQAAQAALTRGDSDVAKRELQLFLQDNPLHAESHFLLASLLARDGDLEQAMVGFQRTAALQTNHAAARYNLGTALLERENPVAAARVLEEAVALRPEHVPSYNNLAKAYFLAGLPELAAASYQEVLRRDPSNGVASRNLALLRAAASHEEPTQPAGAASRLPQAGQTEKTAAATPPPAFSTSEDPRGDEPDVEALREIVRDLPYVTAERRGGQLALGGWTRDPKERKLLDRILIGRTNVLDLTSDDSGDPHRLLEVDTIIFIVSGADSQTIGHNFLRRITVSAGLADAALSSFSWFYSAAINYDVNIANAAEGRLALLARPHLTTLSGSSAKFTAGGDVVYKVTGNVGGDIKPYPFGTTLTVTPTLLRTPGEDGSPRVRLMVETGRKTILSLDTEDAQNAGGSSTVFANVAVTSEAILGLGQTLILTGLNQRESQTARGGVPGLRSVPVVKYLFSTSHSRTADLSVIILLTPRDPAYWDEQYRESLAEFVEMRRAFVRSRQGTAEDMRQFRERYPQAQRIAPNRFGSHFFLMEASELYRIVAGQDLAGEGLDLDLLGVMPKKKEPKNKAKARKSEG